MDQSKKVFLYRSPVGVLEIVGSRAAINSVSFSERGASIEVPPEEFSECIRQLDEYFSGFRTEFALKLDPEGTAFQKRVWSELARIPFGETISYQELANRLGDPKAVRAVGGANGKNPIAIIVPCHRVIGASGKLVGYGGGMERKKWLLQHEAAHRTKEGELF